MRLSLGLLALCAGGPAFAQPGQVYDPNAPTAPPPEPDQPQPPITIDKDYRYGPIPRPPPIRATFMSTDETRWDVRVDGNAVCTTPCELGLETLQHVTMHSQDRAPQKLSAGYLPHGYLLVRAQPKAQGTFAAGVTFTALSGMGLATGITLTAVGCSTDRDGMCTAGLITGAASAVGLYLSIGLIRSAMPRLRIDRTQPYTTGNTVGVAHRF